LNAVIEDEVLGAAHQVLPEHQLEDRGLLLGERDVLQAASYDLLALGG